jgi:hypothetical protein
VVTAVRTSAVIAPMRTRKSNEVFSYIWFAVSNVIGL